MKNEELLNVKNSSSTFYRLMRKYRKRNNKNILNNKGNIANAIEEKRQKLQLEERDDMYIYKESKNIANMNELLLNLYGNKAKKRFYDVSKFFSPIKLDKKLFFVQGKKEEKNIEKNDFNEEFINKKGMMRLPLIFTNIFSNKISEKDNNKNYLTERGKKRIDNKKILKLIDIEKDINNLNKKEKIGINALKLSLNDKKRNKNNENNKDNNISKSYKNILKTQYQKNNIKIENKGNDINKDIKLNNPIKKIKNELTLSDEYISSLTYFNDQLIEEEKRKRNYFNKNDYGCNNFKEKYNYLTIKYFNKK